MTGAEDLEDHVQLLTSHCYLAGETAADGSFLRITFTRALGEQEDPPPVLTRAYHGKPADVALQQEIDAQALALEHYYPTSENYQAGEWGSGAWALAALLILAFGLGLLVLIYLVAVKPAGYLTVIYERRVPLPARRSRATARAGRLRSGGHAPSSGVGPAPRSVIDDLERLANLHARGVLTDEEFETQKSRLLQGP